MKHISMERLFQEIQAGLAEGSVILDIRESDEYKAGHVPGSQNVPLSILPSRIEEIRRYPLVYVHCQGGVRAQKGVALLMESGLSNLVCVSDGGFGNWRAAGYPVAL